jgi:hypothetical protein
MSEKDKSVDPNQAHQQFLQQLSQTQQNTTTNGQMPPLRSVHFTNQQSTMRKLSKSLENGNNLRPISEGLRYVTDGQDSNKKDEN